MLISTKHLLTKHKALAAFNFGTLETAWGIFEGATEASSPFIFELNSKEASFVGLKTASAIVKSFSSGSLVDFSLHLDHCHDIEMILAASEVGFSSGILDISGLTFDNGCDLVKQLKPKLPVDFLLEVTTESPNHAVHLEELGADLLAVEKDNFCDLQLLKSVHHVTSLPLVMHGGSERSRNEIQEAIRIGVVKINLNTCLRKAWRDGLESTFKESPGMLQSYELLSKSRDNVKRVVIEKLRLINS